MRYLKRFPISPTLLVLCLVCVLACSTPCYAQSTHFQVAINKDVIQPGDTLQFQAIYQVVSKRIPTATFAITIQNNHNQIWQLRYPLIQGESMGQIVLPKNLPEGSYNLMFGVLPVFFRLEGEVLFPEMKNGLIVQVEQGEVVDDIFASIDSLKRFSIDSLYFEGNATMIFNQAENRTEPVPPFVALRTWLDSSYNPVAYSVKQILVKQGEPNPALKPEVLNKETFFNNDFSCFGANYAAQINEKRLKHLSGLALYDALYPLQRLELDTVLATYNLLDGLPGDTYENVFDLLTDKLGPLKIDLAEFGKFAPADANDKSVLAKKQRIKSPAPPHGFSRKRIFVSENVVGTKGKQYRILNNHDFGNHALLFLRLQEFAAIRIGYMLNPSAVSENWRRPAVIILQDRLYPFQELPPVRNMVNVKGYTPAIYTLPINQ